MFKDNDRIGIFGISGSGKTHLCKNLQGYFKNVFIIDTADDYNDEINIPRFYDYNSFADYVLLSQGDTGIRCIFKCPISRQDNVELVDAVVELLYWRGDCTIVIEEIHNYATPYYCPPYFKHLALTGRHRNCNFIFTTQRIAEVNKTMLSQCHYRFSGFVDNPTDEKTLKEWGVDINEINILNQYEFIMRVDRKNYRINNDLQFI